MLYVIWCSMFEFWCNVILILMGLFMVVGVVSRMSLVAPKPLSHLAAIIAAIALVMVEDWY